MKQMIRLGGIVSAFCMVAIAQGPAVALGESAGEAGWAKMAQCATLGDDKARHTCTDDALREAGLLTDETKATAKRKAFGLQKPTPLAAAAAPPAPAPAAAPASAASPAPQPKQDPSEHLEVTLAKVDHAGDGKLVLTTTDGAVWHQVESDAVRQVPKQGEMMKIVARSLGGFMCQPSKYVSFRCYRSK
jgi:hypothetical protein